MIQLDPRKELIIQALISEYISAAEPIGSELIAQKYQLGVRSATIRNELAEMEEMGYLEQPHTSAGRIPSDLGYRYYVNYLTHQLQPKSISRKQFQQITKEGELLQNTLREATRLLSRMTCLMSIAIVYKANNVTVRNVILNYISPTRTLLVLILSNGQIENRVIEYPSELRLEDLSIINQVLIDNIQGKSLQVLTKLKPFIESEKDTPTSIHKICAILHTFTQSIARELLQGDLIIEGEGYMFAKPESKRNPTYLEGLVHSLSDQELLYIALTSNNEVESTIIGKENYSSRLYPFTLMRRTFWVGNEEVGAIGLMGPTRLNYELCIPLLSYAADSVTTTLTRQLLG